ncbi:MAG TPA: serine/threonine-protein kinase, partial [Kofleriaceae bacterium]|nr:serine/threonine-protein kinase [Kofleriaceae bacterium]
GAKQPRIGKRVAIKILSRAYCGDPTVVARFEQEARFVNEIRHPNIVDVFQFGELPDKRSFFVMEWLDGESLTTRIERGALPAREAIEILDVICDALQAAHEAKVIHRDLKSDNVYLVTMRGKRTVKLLDFGLAKLAGRGTEGAPIGTTKSGIVVGTPAYMSPEQARGKSVDARTDIYALGILAYKMLTGALPFKADNAMDLIVQQLNAPPPQPIKLAPKTPAALSKLVVQMMAKAPEARPTIEQIRTVFAEVMDRATPVPRSPRPKAEKPEGPIRGTLRSPSQIEQDSEPEPPPPPRRKLTGVLLAAIVLLASVIGIAVFQLAKKQEAPAAAPKDDVNLTVSAESLPSAATGPATAPTTTGSAGSAAPAVAQPTIEFEDERVGAGSGSSAHKHHVKKPAEDVDDSAAEPEPIPANRPGGIIISLQHASKIEIDGKVVAASGMGGRYEVPPGHHTIHISASDRVPISREIDVEPGGTAVVHIADDTGTPAPDPGASQGSN